MAKKKYIIYEAMLGSKSGCSSSLPSGPSSSEIKDKEIKTNMLDDGAVTIEKLDNSIIELLNSFEARIENLEKSTIYDVSDIFNEDYEGWDNRITIPGATIETIFGNYTSLESTLQDEIVFSYNEEFAKVVSIKSSSSQVILVAHFREFVGELFITYDADGNPTDGISVYYAPVRQSQIEELTDKVEDIENNEIIWTEVQ